MGDLIVLTSSQNVAAFDRNGQLEYHQHYEPPGCRAPPPVIVSGPTRATTRSSAAAAARAWRSSACTPWTSTCSSKRPATPIAASTCSPSVPTPRADGISFVKVDKATGQGRGRVWTTERSRGLAVDAVADRVFLKTADEELTAYGFAGRD